VSPVVILERDCEFILKDLTHIGMILLFLIAQYTRHKFYDILLNVHIWCQNSWHVPDDIPNSLAKSQMVMSLFLWMCSISHATSLYVLLIGICPEHSASLTVVTSLLYFEKPIECVSFAYFYQTMAHIISNAFSTNHMLTMPLYLITHHYSTQINFCPLFCYVSNSDMFGS
jgi:hypothetical protein